MSGEKAGRQVGNATGVCGKGVHFGLYPILTLRQMRTGARQKSVEKKKKKILHVLTHISFRDLETY